MAHDISEQPISLPIQVISRVDVNRLAREAEGVDEFLTQSAIRQPGTSVKMPRTSKLLDDLLTANKLNILLEDQRRRLIAFLKEVSKEAPVLHMSFSADPSPVFLQKLMTWLRREVHPMVLLQVGLQPNIGAGCVVRTPNHYFDFSLRQKLTAKRGLLLAKLSPAAQPEVPPA